MIVKHKKKNYVRHGFFKIKGVFMWFRNATSVCLEHWNPLLKVWMRFATEKNHFRQELVQKVAFVPKFCQLVKI